MSNPTKDRNYLKSRFETNNVPSEQDYADLIDAAVNQSDDGVYKMSGDPLTIDAGVNGDPRKRVLQFNQDYHQDPVPDWLLELDPAPGAQTPGLNFVNRDQKSALFLSSGPERRIGMGTTQPGAGLHVHNDSPQGWNHDTLAAFISLELGHEGNGGVGSILMNSDAPGEQFFVRAAGNAARLDYSNGQYLLNSDPDVTGGNPGVLQIADGNGTPRIQLHADGDSYFTSGNVGLGIQNPQARLQVVGGAIMPASGNNQQSGILFPADPGGGSGDSAWMRYYARSGESTTLEIGISNDGDDNIALMSSGGIGINHNLPTATLDIQVNNNPQAIALHSNQWNLGTKFRINTDGTLAEGRVAMAWEGAGYNQLTFDNHGRTLFKDVERNDGAGLRVGSLWGEYGIFAENGAGAVGGVDGVSLQNRQVRITADGKMGIGTETPSAQLHIANDSPAAYLYQDVSNDVSLELGKDMNGALGSIKLHSYQAGQFNFIRPSNGNFHLDATTGYYYINWDSSVHQGNPGRLILGGRAGNNLLMLNTEGDSFFNGGNVGIGTQTPEAKLQVTGGAIMPQPGNNDQSGIMFPRDPFGGGGDAAWIRYYSRGGETTTFEIGTSNDHDDNLVLISPGGIGVNHHEPVAALDIHSPNDFALSLRRTSWAANNRWQINTEGGQGSEFLAFSWNDVNNRKFVIQSNGRVGIGTYTPNAQLDVSGVTIDGTQGRNYFKDNERNDGLGLRVGTAWGKYGLYAENGPAVVGGNQGVHFQNEMAKITADGKMVIGDGRPPGIGKLLVDGRIDVHYGGAQLFNGLYNSATDERAQLVLQSRYSDLVIASSQNNGNHGSTLTFATSDPANANNYRKFVFNQGNWGARKHFLEIGYDEANHPNPHTVVLASNVMTLNGLENRVGIDNRDPQHALDVTGEIKTSEPYLMTTAATFTVGGDINKFYPVVFEDGGWAEGVLDLEIFRFNTHENSSWRGTIMARIETHNTNWGHGSEFIELDVVQTQRFIAKVGHVAKAPRVIVWLKGGGTSYHWRSNQKVSLLDATAVDSKITFDGGGQNDEVATSMSAVPADFDHDVFHFSSRGSGNSFLAGMIMMWTGSVAPSGWAICDGSNGTPDLRGRFVVGAGHGAGLSNRPANQTGGAESVALSVAQLPSHTHGINDPGHFHTWNASRQMAGVDDHNNGSEFSRGDNAASDPVHKNTDSKGTGISIQNTGNGHAHENMPPFYALAYIMKL